jgi:hypothetical protein
MHPSVTLVILVLGSLLFMYGSVSTVLYGIANNSCAAWSWHDMYSDRQFDVTEVVFHH